MQQLTIAGIGSRDTPKKILECMEQTGAWIAAKGYVLRSGAADGADSAFERGFDLIPYTEGHKEIFLPWREFNGHPSDLSWVDGKAMNMAARFHPAWHRLSRGAAKLMARNCYQVLGENLASPAHLIICYTKEGLGQGGTGQAIRIAEAYSIPIWDYGLSIKQGLSVNEAQTSLMEFLIANQLLLVKKG